MDGYLKQSTASQTRTIGPFVDDTDFKTAETGLTIANTDIRVKKNGANDVDKNSGGGTHDINGQYHLTWDATDTDTVGQLSYSVKVAGALQVWGHYVVLEEAVYDALFAASAPGYGTAQTGDSFAVVNSGTHGNSALKTLIDAIDNFLDTEIAAILEDTSTTLDDAVDDLEGRLTAALATQLAAHSLGVGRGVVDASSTTTAVIFKSVNGAAASGTDDFYNGRHIVFTNGALMLQATSISDYTGASKTATVPALTGAPAEDVTFVIV